MFTFLKKCDRMIYKEFEKAFGYKPKGIPLETIKVALKYYNTLKELERKGYDVRK